MKIATVFRGGYPSIQEFLRSIAIADDRRSVGQGRLTISEIFTPLFFPFFIHTI